MKTLFGVEQEGQSGSALKTVGATEPLDQGAVSKAKSHVTYMLCLVHGGLTRKEALALTLEMIRQGG